MKYDLLADGTAEITGASGSSTEFYVPTVLDGYKVTSIGDYAFAYCSDITSVIIPDSVTNIGHEAFYDCSDLTTVEIPDSVTSIGYYAFHSCKNLISVTLPESLKNIGDYAFLGCNKFVANVYENSYAHQYALTWRLKHIVLESPSKTIMGDVNGDEIINIRDATIVQKYISGFLKTKDIVLSSSDVNKDSSVDVADSTLIQKYEAGLVSGF